MSTGRREFCGIICLSALVSLIARTGKSQDFVYVPKVAVAAETKLDWLFPFLHKSPATAPDDRSANFSAKHVSYELYGPTNKTGQPLPLVIFISPIDKPIGWYFWGPACQRNGVVFAGVSEAGNGHPPEERIRKVIEVLGDLRRRFDIDADRTYISGFSGGGQIASIVGLHLPEYFGGLVVLGALSELPESRWLVDAAAERLSIATACGANDPVALPAESFSQKELTALSIRSQTHISRGEGHKMPRWQVLESALIWLEDDLPRRRELAREHPSTRIADTPSREEWAQRIWDDANRRLNDDEQISIALDQLEGIVRRWPDLSIAASAQELLDEYEAKPAHPWEEVWAETERRRTTAIAAGYEQLALNRSHHTTATERADYARSCLAIWNQLSGEDGAAVSDERIAAMREVIAKDKSTATSRVHVRATSVPLKGSRFELKGTKTRWDALVSFTHTLQRLGYDVSISAEASATQSQWDTAPVKFDLTAASFDRLVATVLTPMDLTYTKSRDKITIVPR